MVVYIDRMITDGDDNYLLLKKVSSSLEESEMIVVDDPPSNLLDALLFWAGKDWVTAPDPETDKKAYHVECTNSVSRTVKEMYPFASPNTRHKPDPTHP